MRFILIVIIFLIGWARAVTPAYYLHHERTTQATVEADCQNRELCLDKQNLAPLGRFNDGTLWHGVTQEKPNVNLTGTLTVTGATVLSNNLTLSLFATGRIPYTTTAGLLTSGTGLTYDGTTFNVTGIGAISGNATIGGTLGVTGVSTFTGAIAGANQTLSGTLGVTGVSTFTAAPVFSSATASLPMFTNASKALVSNPVTGTVNVVMSNSPTIATPTISSPTITGTIAGASETLSGTLAVTGVSGFAGATANTAAAIWVGQSAVSTQGSGTTQYGIVLNPTSGTDATLEYNALYVNARSNASVTNLFGTRIVTSTKNSGTVTNNYGLKIEDQTVGSTNYALYTGLGAVVLGGATTLTGGLTSSAGGGYETGTFTMSLSGFSAASIGTFSAGTITATASFVRIGKAVTLFIPQMYGTSNATNMDVAGIPATIQVATGQAVTLSSVANNGTFYYGYMQAGQNGTSLVSYQSAIGTTTSIYTSSGNKGFINAMAISYTTF